MLATQQTSPETSPSSGLARMASCKYIVEETDNSLVVTAVRQFPWIAVGVSVVVFSASIALAAFQASHRLPPNQNLSIGSLLSDERSLLILGIVGLVLVGIWIALLSCTARMLQLNPIVYVSSTDRALTLDGVDKGTIDGLSATVDVGFKVNAGVDSREYEYQRSLELRKPNAHWVVCRNMLSLNDLRRVAHWINDRSQSDQAAVD